MIRPGANNNLHTLSWYASILLLRCRSCGRRSALGGDALPIYRGNMTPLYSLRFRCSCGATDPEKWIAQSEQEAEDFVAGRVHPPA